MTPKPAFEQNPHTTTNTQKKSHTQHTSFPSKTQPWIYKSQRIYYVGKWHRLVSFSSWETLHWDGSKMQLKAWNTLGSAQYALLDCEQISS